jgi:hypothetical protein
MPVFRGPTSHWPCVQFPYDLDEFQGISVKLNEQFIIALKHYSGHPPNTTTIYLPGEITDVALIVNILIYVQRELGIPAAWVSWNRQDNPDY